MGQRKSHTTHYQGIEPQKPGPQTQDSPQFLRRQKKAQGRQGAKAANWRTGGYIKSGEAAGGGKNKGKRQGGQKRLSKAQLRPAGTNKPRKKKGRIIPVTYSKAHPPKGVSGQGTGGREGAGGCGWYAGV